MNFFRDKLLIKDMYIFIFIFMFIFSRPLGTLMATIIFIYWIFKFKDYNKVKLFFSSKIMIGFSVYFLVFILGILISENSYDLFHPLRKHRWFLYIPAFVWFFRGYREKIIKYYIFSTMALVSCSYLLFFKIWLPIYEKDFNFFCPFHHHVSHGIFVSIGLFFLLESLKKCIPIWKKLLVYFISIIFIYNILFTQGRMSQIIMMMTIFFHILSFFGKRILKGLGISLLISILIFLLAFKMSSHFNKRIYEGINDFKIAFEDDTKFYRIFNGRMGMWQSCWKIFKKNPILGVGNGDFSNEYVDNYPLKYRKYGFYNFIKKHNGNPHSYFLLILARNGLLGLLSFCYIFYQLFKKGIKYLKKKVVFLYIPTVFFFINFTDIYMQKHNFQGLFIIFISILYLYNDNNLRGLKRKEI